MVRSPYTVAKIELEGREDERTKARRWRDTVQRAFLSKSDLTTEDMPELDALFKEIEADEQMSRDALATSSLPRAIRSIAFLPETRVPLDTIYRFRERANQIIKKWDELVYTGSSAPSGVGGQPATSPQQAAPPLSDVVRDPEVKMIRQWRHEVQKMFLGRRPMTDQVVVAADELFKTIESYDGMTLEQLEYSKIGKVMNHIRALQDDVIPEEERYKFRERALALIRRWTLVIKAHHPVTSQDATAEPKFASLTHSVPPRESEEHIGAPKLEVQREASIVQVGAGAQDPNARYIVCGEDWTHIDYESDDWELVEAVAGLRV